jgi:creatinine amidohydrolase
MGSRSIGELTFEEVARLRDTSVLLLPLGSMEQHGPHLPLDTDAVLADALAQAIAERHGEAFDVWTLPALPLGLSREHAWAAGTMTLSVAGMAALLRELAQEIVRALPARNLMIVNAHGGNRGLIDTAIYEMKQEFGLNVCALHTGALTSPVPAQGLPEIHGGRDETSLMLALAPQRVRKERMEVLTRPPAGDAVRSTILDPAVSWPWSSGDPQLADLGVIGSVEGASAEHGRKILERIVTAAGGALKRLTEQRRTDPA